MEITRDMIVPGAVFYFKILGEWKMTIEKVEGDEVALVESRKDMGKYPASSWKGTKTMEGVLKQFNYYGDFVEAPQVGEEWKTEWSTYEIVEVKNDLVYYRARNDKYGPSNIDIVQFVKDCQRVK